MVFVDHATHFGPMLPPPPSGDAAVTSPMPDPIPSTPSGVGHFAAGIESDPNFSKLSARDREFHLWATAQTRNQKALQSNHELMPECFSLADAGCVPGCFQRRHKRRRTP
jgi:hypothetical protein